jgi:formamidopyrimidine-DNA glycosylase
MPELPEVETVVRALREPLIGHTFTGVTSSWPRQIVTPQLEEMAARLRQARVEAVTRRGKYLLFRLDNGETLIIHLKMSGHLSVVPSGSPPDSHDRTVFTLAGGHELRFRDTRKFGRIYLVKDPDQVLSRLGPEPLSDTFTPEWLRKRLAARRRILKPLLLDQTFIAGIGNIYADEALHRAGLRPNRRSDSLSDDEVASLHRGIRSVLALAIEREGASMRTYRQPDGSQGSMQEEFQVYGRAGEPCFRCGAPVERFVLAGRSTYFCPGCQE